MNLLYAQGIIKITPIVKLLNIKIQIYFSGIFMKFFQIMVVINIIIFLLIFLMKIKSDFFMEVPHMIFLLFFSMKIKNYYIIKTLKI